MKKSEAPPALGVVLLAAGGSVRLGQPKQLVPIEGEALVRRTARRLLSLKPATLIVVSGCESVAVKNQLSDLPLQIVHNPDWQKGMGSSIAIGAKQLPADVNGVLIMLCDQWGVSQKDLQHLFDAWKSDISVINASSWKEDKAIICGPPVIFPGILIHELISLTGDQGAKRIIEKYRGNSAFVLMEKASLDLDKPGDLQDVK